MDDDLMRRRVTEARVATLGTVTVGGRPHLVPCCFAVRGEVLYTAVDDVKPKATTALRRLDNIRARPDVTVLVDHYDDDWSTLWWIRMEGDAALVELASDEGRRGSALLAEKYEQYRGAPFRGPLVAIAVRRWRAWP